jgi:hypothetical protein
MGQNQESRMTRMVSMIALALCATGLSACGSDTSKKEAAKLDSKLLGKGEAADPALTSALEDQIMVDPSLSSQSNAHAIRPTDEPVTAPVPPVKGEAPAVAAAGRSTVTLGQLAKAQSSGQTSLAGVQKANFNGCGLDVDYAMGWANRLPAALPMPEQARVEEAAGSDLGRCRLRAVTFTTSTPIRGMIDYYVGNARKAGFSAEHRSEANGQVVGGTRSDGAAYYVILTEREGGGTSADFVTNAGV